MGNELIYYRSSVLETNSTPELLAGTDDTPENDLILSVETNHLLLSVTEQQYSRMLSALFNGAYRAYPLDFIAVVYPLIKAGKMTLCDAVLDCILDTDEIQQAIASYSNSSAITETTPENQTILDTDIFQSQGPCDNDNIYGMTVQLTAFLNAVSEDILEVFVTAFAVPGRLGDIIEAIPGVGSLPFDDILQFMEKLAEQVNDAYQSAYDIQIAEDISCALFCIAQGDCTLTMEDARDWFQQQLTESVENTDFLTVANDIIANNWLGEQSIYVMHWLILDTIIFGGEMLGVDVNRLTTTIASYFNDPDSDWSTLCLECQWTQKWLAGDGNPVDDDWVISTGAYNGVTEEIDWANWSASSNGIVTRYTFTGSFNITRVHLTGRIYQFLDQRFTRIRIYNEFDVEQEGVFVVMDATPPNQTINLTLSGIDVDVEENWYLEVLGHATIPANPESPEGEIYFETLEVQGGGTNPWA